MASKKGSGGGTLDDGALDGPTLPSGSAKPQLPAARPAAPKRDSMRSPVGAPRPVAPSVSSNSRPATPAGPPAPAPRGTSKPQTRSFAVARPAPVPLPGEDDDVPSGATDELPGVGATDRNGTAVASIGGDQDEKLGTAILDLAPALQKAEGTAIVDLESAVAARGLRSAPAPTASRGPYILGAVAMVLIGGVLLAAWLQGQRPSLLDLQRIYIQTFPSPDQVSPPPEQVTFDLQKSDDCAAHPEDTCLTYRVSAPRLQLTVIVYKGADHWTRDPGR